MEKFLKNYIKMFLMCDDEKLTKKEIEQITKKLIMTDEIWTTLEHYIDSYIVDIKSN